ncbi:hypothetical protein KR093_007785 [Drosophila rubida]|uniref:Uncharacterized protein n=1 Tax=Drosophila rubida TaxID=30044 RepID=A0AAD4JTV2_9MUSC|nr:hypothetical protein KR093_007785 [Drosophila rubida]
MWQNRVVLVLVVVFGAGFRFSKATMHRIEFEDDEVYSECPNQPSNVLNVSGLMNLSELTIDSQVGQMQISGNLTMQWDIQKSDRIQVILGGTLELFKFERREWVPTIYKIATPDFCPLLYDENQYWYKLWVQHIVNIDEIRDKCLNVPGTKMIHKTFNLNTEFDILMGNFEGLHKLRVELKAFDKQNKQRPTAICCEFVINFYKTHKRIPAIHH